MYYKHGISTIFVRKIGNIIIKKLKTHNKFLKELHIYQLLNNWPYIPPLLGYNEQKQHIYIKHMGTSLNIKYSPKNRKRLKLKICNICKELHETYGLYHNDIRWKNIIETSTGNLLLVDWEVASFVKNERDPERILGD